MQSRLFTQAGRAVSEVGFGAWAIGGSWGDVTDADAKAALNAALDAGVDFIDTADVYGDGRSEMLIAEVLKARSGPRPLWQPRQAAACHRMTRTAIITPISRGLWNGLCATCRQIALTLCNCIVRLRTYIIAPTSSAH